MINLITHIESILPLSNELRKRIEAISHQQEVKRGDVLVSASSDCDKIYFINKGLLRGYYFQEDKEITSWFAMEGEFATSFYSFISGEKAVENIQSLEQCSLFYIKRDDLNQLYKSFPDTERIGRIITEDYYIKLESRIISLQFKSAKERYQNLFVKNPMLLNRAPLGQIASYLGITQETLSRIRTEF